MDRIWAYRGAAGELAELGFVAVAVKQIDASQRHVGVLHRTEDGDIEMLHLAFHKDLRNHRPRPWLVVVRPDLRPSRARSVATMCRLIWESHGAAGLPYGLSYRMGRFDPQTADLLLDEESAGLTCATFVLAIFASCGIHLIDTENWPPRLEDAEWHQKILQMLREDGAPADHLKAVSDEKGCARFRPEEVAGACLVDEPPGGFDEVERGGLNVMDEIQRIQTALP